MDIHFCDLCNESVPDSDLAIGRAYRRKGRVVCATCDSAMGGADGTEGDGAPAEGSSPGDSPATSTASTPGQSSSAPSPDAPARQVSDAAAPVVVGGSGAGGVIVGMMALVFTALGLWSLLNRLEDQGQEQRTVQSTLESDLRESRRVHDVFVAGLGELFRESEERVQEGEAALRGPLQEELRTLRADLASSVEREAAVAAELRSVREAGEAQDAKGLERLQAMNQNLVDLEKDLLFYKDRVIDLEETLRSLSAGGTVLGAGGAPAAARGTGQGRAREWEALLPNLKHTNVGLRLEAIYDLGKTGDKDVIEHLIPMLQDEEVFVRMATARTLEDLDARAAVPALIDALEDTLAAVRESAVVALRRITGKEYGFDPVASDMDRAKKLKAWRDWWKRGGDNFLTGG